MQVQCQRNWWQNLWLNKYLYQVYMALYKLVVNDDEYDKQHGDFTNEYEDCIVVVKNNKN